MDLQQKIEAILFYRGEPVKVSELAKLTEHDLPEVQTALSGLEEALSGRGISLMRTTDAVSLATAPELSGLIEHIAKEEVSRDLGKAGLETLSIIVYLGPVSRSRIDWIRGVNSSFIVRNLLVRGLVDRIPNPNDSRSYLYRPTFELLSHLGVTKVEDLPGYKEERATLEKFEESSEEQEGDTVEREEEE